MLLCILLAFPKVNVYLNRMGMNSLFRKWVYFLCYNLVVAIRVSFHSGVDYSTQKGQPLIGLSLFLTQKIDPHEMLFIAT